MPSEHELMDRYGVGRPSIREAMQALENMGLITIQQGERARVKRMTAEDILNQIDGATRHLLYSSSQNLEQLMEARQVFESGVTLLAAKRATDNDIKKLKKRLEYMRECQGERSKFLKADQAFHICIAEISGNSILLAVSKAMFKWLSGHHIDHHRNLIGVPGMEDLTLKEHAAIFDRIAKRDSNGAANLISEHILRVNKLFVQIEKSNSSS